MKRAKVLTVIAIIVLIIVILASLLFVFYWNKLDLLQYDDGTKDQPSSIGESSVSIKKQGKEDKDEQDEQNQEEVTKVNIDELVSDKEAIENPGTVEDVKKPTIQPKEDDRIINILLIGSDEATNSFSNNANTDSIMIASINTKTSNMKLISIERGTGVPTSLTKFGKTNQYEWISSIIQYGGPGLLEKTVETCFAIDIEGYVRINLQTFIQIVNSCNGVDINLTQKEADYINNKIPEGSYAVSHAKELGISDKVQTVKTGTNHLNGETAVLYARCRYIDSDWGRIQRQRNVIQSAVFSAKNLSINELNLMLNNVLPLIQTNLTKAQISELLLQAPSLRGKTIEQMSLPESGTYSIMQGLYGKNMYAVDFDKNARTLQDFIYGGDKK